MSTIMNHDMLMKRALTFLSDRRAEAPGCSLSDLLDEAGARFNLSPTDTAALESLFHNPAYGESGSKTTDADGQ